MQSSRVVILGLLQFDGQFFSPDMHMDWLSARHRPEDRFDTPHCKTRGVVAVVSLLLGHQFRSKNFQRG